MKPTRVLFVCHGNICRSPMAEAVFRHLAREAGLDGAFHISSAALSREELGNDIYPPAKRMLRQMGIPFAPHRARLVTERELAEAALVLIMDGDNLRRMHRLFGERFDAKTHLLMEYAGETRDVADPWYTDDFAQTYRDIDAACRGLLRAAADR